MKSLAWFAASLVGVLSAGCLSLKHAPCSTGEGCPRGYACVQSGGESQCEPVGSEGAAYDVHVGLQEGLSPSGIGDVVFQSLVDPTLDCVFRRDPNRSDLTGVPLDVHALVNLGDPPTTVRMPAGRHVIVVRGRPASGEGEDVARACVVASPEPGSHGDLWVTLRRSNGSCQDGIVDVREECDDGPGGSVTCSPDCVSLPVVVHDGGGCLGEPSAACTSERCLVGWLEGGSRAIVDVLYLSGAPDTTGDRGIDASVSGAAGLRVVAGTTLAAALWRAGSGGLSVQMFNGVGQPGQSLPIPGDTSNAIHTMSRMLTDSSEQPYIVGGWITAAGHATLIDPDPEAPLQWDGELGAAIGPDVSATFWGDWMFASWSVEGFINPGDTEVVGRWLGPTGEQLPVEGPAPIPEETLANQLEVSVASPTRYEVVMAWRDQNNAHEDQFGAGIRARWFTRDSAYASVQVNSTVEGDQVRPYVAAGHDYALVAWVDLQRGEVRGRFLDSRATLVPISFDQGQNADIFVDGGSDQIGRPVVAISPYRAYIFWVENASGCSAGGRRLMLRSFPRP